MNIGFIINFSKNDWLGGYNYYLHLIESLEKFSDREIKPIIIFDKKKRVFENKEFKKYSYKICSYFSNSNKYLRIFNKLLIIIFGKSFLYEKFLKENKMIKLSLILKYYLIKKELTKLRKCYLVINLTSQQTS